MHETPRSAERPSVASPPERPGTPEPTNADLAAALARFRLRWGDEDACLRHVEQVRWPDGFACPTCTWKGEPWRFQRRPRVLGCRGCAAHVSITAGTPMDRAHLPLPVWYGMAALLRLAPDLSTRRLQRLLSLPSYGTCFALRSRVRASLLAQEFPWPAVETNP